MLIHLKKVDRGRERLPNTRPELTASPLKSSVYNKTTSSNTERETERRKLLCLSGIRLHDDYKHLKNVSRYVSRMIISVSPIDYKGL